MSLNVELLESSFAQIQQKELEFTTHFYSSLFADYPEIQPLFAHTQMKDQANKLFKSLVLIVESLRDPNALTQTLKGLGTRHIQYGVLPQHYPIVGNTLLKAFSLCLENAWTPKTEQAWQQAYSVVADLMLSGATDSSEILSVNAAQN